MPLGTSIVHPGLFAALRPSFWRHTVTIEQDTQTQDEIGGISHSWATLAGHADIACNLGRKPDSLGEITTERRDPFSTYNAELPRAMLNGLYTSITTAHRALISTRYYNIRGVQHDSALNLTMLTLELIG